MNRRLDNNINKCNHDDDDLEQGMVKDQGHPIYDQFHDACLECEGEAVEHTDEEGGGDPFVMKVVRQRANEAKTAASRMIILAEAEGGDADASALPPTPTLKDMTTTTTTTKSTNTSNQTTTPTGDDHIASMENSQPGAYAMRTSMTTRESGHSLSTSIVDSSEQEGEEEGEGEGEEEFAGLEEVDSNSNVGLVEAIEVVQGDVPIGHALPQEQESTSVQDKADYLCKNAGCLLLFAFLILLPTVVGFVYHFKRDTNNSTQPEHSMPSLAPTIASSGSTGSPLQLLYNQLPNYTLTSLQDPNSPQFHAWHWLEEHQDLYSMPEWRKKQLFALSCFYYAFGGPDWPAGLDKDWLDDTKSECLWYSGIYGFFYNDGSYKGSDDASWRFTCNEKGEFETLILTQASRLGFSIDNPVMPLEVSFLSSLRRMEFGSSGATNATVENVMPKFLLQHLSNLEHLRLKRDYIAGMIPSQLGLLTKLTDLRIWANSLTGTLPTELGCLTHLTGLDLSNNLLSGPVPSQVGLLTKLQVLEMQSNFLTGRIPTEISSLVQLQKLRMSSNSLSGGIPSEFGLLTMLHELSLDSNFLTGSIPLELAAPNAPQAQKIDLAGNNELTGVIPEELCALNHRDNCSFTVAAAARRGETACGFEADCTDSLCGCDCPRP